MLQCSLLNWKTLWDYDTNVIVSVECQSSVESVYCCKPKTSPLYPLQGPSYILTVEVGEAADKMTWVETDSHSMCYARPRTCLNYDSVYFGVELNCLSAILRQQNRWTVIVADQKNWIRPSIWGSHSMMMVKETCSKFSVLQHYDEIMLCLVLMRKRRPFRFGESWQIRDMITSLSLSEYVHNKGKLILLLCTK